MTKTTKVKTKASNLPVPQSKDECSAQVRKIGELDATLSTLETDMQKALAEVKADFEDRASYVRERREELLLGVQTFCDANRKALTGDGRKKSIKFPAGTVAWRNRPPSCTIRGTDKVIKALQGRMLARYIRTKFEVDKEAILADPDGAKDIKGITIKSGVEDFVVEPFAPKLAEGGVK